MQLSDAYRRCGVALVVLALLSAPLAGAAVGGVAGASDAPTLTVADAETSVDSSTTVTLRLSNAPNGVAGFDLRVALTNASVATITGVSYGGNYPVTNSTVTDDGARAYASGIDLNKVYEDGASDVPLVTVTVRGAAAGTTQLEVTGANVDNDDGNDVNPTLTAGTIRVTGDSGGSSGGNTGTGGAGTGGGVGGGSIGGTGGSGGATEPVEPSSTVTVTDTTSGATAHVRNVTGAPDVTANFSAAAVANGTGVKAVDFDLSQAPGDFTVNASEPSPTPADAPPLAGATTYFAVSTSGLNESVVASASLTVTVAPNATPAGGVQLYHYANGSWHALSTMQTGEHEYTAQTDGFSPFAVGPPANESDQTTQTTTQDTTTTTQSDGTTSANTTADSTTTTSGTIPGFGPLTVLAALGALFVAYARR
ncbi:hypothetical protein [Halarchaeum sp. P4]|uniref:hypothetical protein n=1 Tax=Halarchaeum sp. P4 TaxID=3421639 RepID=UPI003EB7CA62